MADQVTTSLAEAKVLVMQGLKGEDGTDGKSLRVNEQGHIIYWNDETQQWVDTGIEAEGAPGPQGEPGFSPTVSVSAITGGHRVTITDEDGAHSFDVMDGEDGEDGEAGAANFIRIDYNGSTSAVTYNGEPITGTQIKALLDQPDAGAIMVDTAYDPDAVYHLKNIYSDGRVEFEGELGDVVINVVVPATNSTGYATVTRKTQVYYYLNGTTVKSAQTNNAVTSQQIYNATIKNGFAPIIYVDEYSERWQFHYYSMDSGGINFRTIDGAQEIRVPLNSSTVSRSFVNPYSVYAVYDSENSKYVLKKGSTLSSENVTYSDLSKHFRAVWMNSQLPIHKLTLSDGYMEFRFIDMQVANGGVSVVQWLVQAGSQTGVAVTRSTI